MLKLMIGLLRPTQGQRAVRRRATSAELDGKELVKMRLRFGFLFQMAALFDSLTIFDNVAFGLREHRVCDEAQARQIVAERLHEVGLPAGDRDEEAGRALRRPAEAGRAGPGPGDRPGSDALRRADDRARPDHERRDQRADPPDPADARRRPAWSSPTT